MRNQTSDKQDRQPNKLTFQHCKTETALNKTLQQKSKNHRGPKHDNRDSTSYQRLQSDHTDVTLESVRLLK